MHRLFHRPAPHPGSRLARVVEMVCRKSLHFPAIGAAALGGALVAGGLPARLSPPPGGFVPMQQAASLEAPPALGYGPGPVGGGGVGNRPPGTEPAWLWPTSLHADAAPSLPSPGFGGLSPQGTPQGSHPSGTPQPDAPHAQPAPEPASLVLFATGIAGMLYARRRRQLPPPLDKSGH